MPGCQGALQCGQTGPLIAGFERSRLAPCIGEELQRQAIVDQSGLAGGRPVGRANVLHRVHVRAPDHHVAHPAHVVGVGRFHEERVVSGGRVDHEPQLLAGHAEHHADRVRQRLWAARVPEAHPIVEALPRPGADQVGDHRPPRRGICRQHRRAGVEVLAQCRAGLVHSRELPGHHELAAQRVGGPLQLRMEFRAAADASGSRRLSVLGAGRGAEDVELDLLVDSERCDAEDPPAVVLDDEQGAAELYVLDLELWGVEDVDLAVSASGELS